jgi:carbamoyl-phosphate synthase large subunit
MEHIEPCGIHSGDSNATLASVQSWRICHAADKVDHTKKIALALNTVGLNQYSVCYKG